MLEHASKTCYTTEEPKCKGQNISKNKNGTIRELQRGTTLQQVDNQPRNLVAFEKAVDAWNEHANIMGAASDLFLGQQPTAGTPFKSVEVQLQEGKSLHLWRQGRIAVFMDEIYRDWVIPHLAKEIIKGTKFLAELSTDEILYVSEAVVRKKTN